MQYYLFNIFYIEKEQANFKTYNPLATLKSGNLTRIITKLGIKPEDKILTEFELSPFDVMVKLFSEIYAIRCDLFHGSADISDFDTNKLIDEANIVLQGFLGRLFDAKMSGGRVI